jgi:hypothetical protein
VYGGKPVIAAVQRERTSQTKTELENAGMHMFSNRIGLAANARETKYRDAGRTVLFQIQRAYVWDVGVTDRQCESHASLLAFTGESLRYPAGKASGICV